MQQEQEAVQVNPQLPLKFKLFLTKEQRQAYRLAADVTNKKSIADYIVYAINTYTAFLLKELEVQVQEKRAAKEQAQENQTASSPEAAPTVESEHVPSNNP